LFKAHKYALKNTVIQLSISSTPKLSGIKNRLTIDIRASFGNAFTDTGRTYLLRWLKANIHPKKIPDLVTIVIKLVTLNNSLLAPKAI